MGLSNWGELKRKFDLLQLGISSNQIAFECPDFLTSKNRIGGNYETLSKLPTGLRLEKIANLVGTCSLRGMVQMVRRSNYVKVCRSD